MYFIFNFFYEGYFRHWGNIDNFWKFGGDIIQIENLGEYIVDLMVI